MRYESVFTVIFHARSDMEACETARHHHEQIRDELLIEGADHPHNICLKHLCAGDRDILEAPAAKSISK
jgi:hypothetical protein